MTVVAIVAKLVVDVMTVLSYLVVQSSMHDRCRLVPQQQYSRLQIHSHIHEPDRLQ